MVCFYLHVPQEGEAAELSEQGGYALEFMTAPLAACTRDCMQAVFPNVFSALRLVTVVVMLWRRSCCRVVL